MNEKKFCIERFEKLVIIHRFIALVNHFSSTGDLQTGVRTGELWDQVREAQGIDWNLKRSLHDLAYKASMGNLNIDDAMSALNSLIEKYDK